MRLFSANETKSVAKTIGLTNPRELVGLRHTLRMIADIYFGTLRTGPTIPSKAPRRDWIKKNILEPSQTLIEALDYRADLHDFADSHSQDYYVNMAALRRDLSKLAKWAEASVALLNARRLNGQSESRAETVAREILVMELTTLLIQLRPDLKVGLISENNSPDNKDKSRGVQIKRGGYADFIRAVGRIITGDKKANFTDQMTKTIRELKNRNKN